MLNEQYQLYKSVEDALGITDFSNRLVHYTSLSSFQKMVESGELWFGRLPDLNDTTEAIHFINNLESAAELLFGPHAYNDLRPTVRRFLPLIREKTFVSSWCEYDDTKPSGSLPMWQVYGDDGRGVAIVIDSTQFQPSSINQQRMNFFVHSTRVDYVSSEESENYASSLVERVLSVNTTSDNPDQKFLAAMLLLAKAPCVKHEDFSHEREIRFLSTFAMQEILGQPISEQKIRTIKVDDGTRQFASLMLREYENFDFDLRIGTLLKKIIVGPGAQQDERCNEVASILRRHGVENVQIETSRTPYISTR